MFEGQRMGRRFGGSANSRHVFAIRDNYRAVVCAVVKFGGGGGGVERRRGCWCW
jgi:hypothetical protein